MMLGRGLFFSVFVLVVSLILGFPEARRLIESPVHNVLDYGAVGDGLHDDTHAFLVTWKASCDSSSWISTIVVPLGKKFYINPLSFEGPCKSTHVNVLINGHIVAPKDPKDWRCYNNCETWIEFKHVNGISIHGKGTIDGRGQIWWDLFKNYNTINRPTKGDLVGGTGILIAHSIMSQHVSTGNIPIKIEHAMRISDCNHVHLSGLKFKNNPRMHVILDGLQSANVTDIHIYSSEKSPNTDGIHVAHSKNVNIAHSVIRTGDDCISIVDGASHVKVHDISCGPGHGISIGSLGKHGAQDRVEYVHVTDAVFNRSTNGARIKTWQGGRGYAKHITFERIRVTEAKNPIIVNQFYCDHEACSNHTNAVKVSNVTFRHVSGTSKGKTAVRLDCSKTVPCEVFMEDIDIKASEEGETATSYCTSARGRVTGTNVPHISCLQQQDRD